MRSRPGSGISWARFVVYGIGDLKEFSNDFWYSITSGSISSGYDYQSAAQAFYTSVSTAWKTALTTSITLRGCYAEFNDGTGTATTDYYHDVAGTGVFTDTMPEDVAVVVRKRTDNFTRSGKGRWYFCGAGAGDTNGSYLNSAGIADWQTLAVALKTAFTSGGVTYSPAHFSAKTGLLYPIKDTPVIALLGTRRRRRGPF